MKISKTFALLVMLFLVGVIGINANETIITSTHDDRSIENIQNEVTTSKLDKQTEFVDSVGVGMALSGTKITESATAKMQRDLITAQKYVEWNRQSRLWNTETNDWETFPEPAKKLSNSDIEVVNGVVLVDGTKVSMNPYLV